MLTALAISSYRSLQNVVMPLGQLTVVTGPNGSGKSNIYRALRLLADAAQGGIVPALSREGGFSSALWAGDRKKGPVSMGLGFASTEFSYAVDLGMPVPIPPSAFDGDPEIKRECIWLAEKLKPSSMVVDRRGTLVRYKDEQGQWAEFRKHFPAYESILANLSDPKRMAEGVILRESIRSWRFYDHFRTDMDAAARKPQTGARTPVLAHDGADLAAAMQTIIEIGDEAGLRSAIDDAFPGAELNIIHDRALFSLELYQPGLHRPLAAAELSDGTLRYLLLVAALLTPRPPALMILNEPETSLHPDLLPALGRLIRNAARSTQIVVVTHAARLVSELEMDEHCLSHNLEKDDGATRISGMGILDGPHWEWPAR